MTGPNTGKGSPAYLPAALAAWLAYLGLDFLTHAVILTRWWQSTEAYWLPPTELLKHIPFAYISFAIYSAGLVWLLIRLLGPRPNLVHSLRFGAVIGLIYGLVTVLANYSVFALPASALWVWPTSTALASLAAAASATSVLEAQRPWKQLFVVFLVVLVVFVLSVLLQNIFFPISGTIVSP